MRTQNTRELIIWTQNHQLALTMLEGNVYAASYAHAQQVSVPLRAKHVVIEGSTSGRHDVAARPEFDCAAHGSDWFCMEPRYEGPRKPGFIRTPNDPQQVSLSALRSLKTNQQILM